LVVGEGRRDAPRGGDVEGDALAEQPLVGRFPQDGERVGLRHERALRSPGDGGQLLKCLVGDHSDSLTSAAGKPKIACLPILSSMIESAISMASSTSMLSSGSSPIMTPSWRKNFARWVASPMMAGNSREW